MREINHLTKLSLEAEIVEGYEPAFDPNKQRENKKQRNLGLKDLRKNHSKQRKKEQKVVEDVKKLIKIF